MSFKRLPKGLGSITKLSGNRRKPYVATKLFEYRYNDTLKTANPKRIIVGYFETRKEAIEALTNAKNVNPSYNATFEQVYEAWLPAKIEGLSYGGKRSYTRSYYFLSPLKDKIFRNITAYDYEEILKNDKIPPSLVRRIAQTVSQMYKYAIGHGMADTEIPIISTKRTENVVKVRKLFTKSEIEALINANETWTDYVCILLYTGMRPGELATIHDIDLDNRVMIGGMKTENGKNRTIPIHKDILPIIQRNSVKSGNSVVLSVYKVTYKTIFYNCRGFIGEHQLYDCRHTFISKWQELGLNTLALKRIVGHSTGDVTEKVYTHLSDSYLVNEMDKFGY